jgi:hypothetical protein
VLVYAIVSRQRAASAQEHHEDAAAARRQRAEDTALASGQAEPDGFTETDGSNRNWSEERGANPPTPVPPRN